MSPLLSVNDLTVTYPRRGEAAMIATRALTFQVGGGEVLGLVGGAGSGKSTALNALGGLLPGPARFYGGTALLDPGTDHEVDLLRARSRQWRRLRRRRIAIFFREVESQWNPRRTVRQHLRETLQLAGRGREWQRESEWMPVFYEVGLIEPENLLGRYPRQLPAVVLQRFLIGMALLKGADLWIADAFTSGLDATGGDQVLRLVRELVERHGIALLFGDSNLSVVERLADRVAVLYEGGIVETGGVTEVLSHPKSRYTRALLDSLPRLGEHRSRLTEIDRLAEREAIEATRVAGE